MTVTFTITADGKVIDVQGAAPDDMPEKLRRSLPKMVIGHVGTFRYPKRSAACRAHIVIHFPDPYEKPA